MHRVGLPFGAALIIALQKRCRVAAIPMANNDGVNRIRDTAAPAPFDDVIAGYKAGPPLLLIGRRPEQQALDTLAREFGGLRPGQSRYRVFETPATNRGSGQ